MANDVNKATLDGQADTTENKDSKQSLKDKLSLFLSSKLPRLKIPNLEELKQDKKKLLIIAGGLGAFVLVLIITSVVLLMKSPNTQDSQIPAKSQFTQPQKFQIPNLEQLNKRGNMDDSELAEMIKKANLLYDQGNKMEALDLFEHIGIFSQSLASYNLGVIKLKEGRYDQALASFDSAISTGEDVAMSAINAAYCAYKLNRQDLTQYYLGISSSHLFESNRQPLYFYLYGLLNMSKGFYFESLSPLLHPNSARYQRETNKNTARLFLLFNDDFNALSSLKKLPSLKDNLPIGLLHARLGEYDKAKQYLQEYLSHFPEDPQALMALQLVKIKLSNFKESALILKRMMKKDEYNPNLEIYPINIKLKADLFNVNIAQENFWNRKFEHKQILSYKILYYYAPLKVFNVKQVVEAIQNRAIDTKLHNIEVAKSGLSEGAGIASVNKNITPGLRELSENNLRKSLSYLKQAVQIYPNHAVLHYNTGVLYAQSGDFDNAYIHFLRAYHLDSSDILSGLFAVMAGKLTYRNTDRIFNTITTNFADLNFDDLSKRDFLLSMIRYLNDSVIEDFNWVRNTKRAMPIYHALQSVYAIGRDNIPLVLEAFGSLKKIYPQDVVANIMYDLSKFYKQNLRDAALELNSMFATQKLDMNSIYFGPSIARELYVYVGFITGMLPKRESELEKKLLSENDNPAGILQALGLLNIYNGDFEKAFVYYNTLIDNIKEDDSHTRFLGAVAALGAGRHENAVALLQLSKLESPTNLEAKFALALLYQETKNFKAAADHYEKVSRQDFVSEYFDFEIDTRKLLVE
ncbi:MAG: tetratricopeptide repeat protein [Helicobacter sp.]|nr:tetratricopeptide repeat protein [Helicobacter sp.]MDD7567788.1 tetratricopeptide repeat protein [Helicobacter sp.]MDY5741095.1 tetratricopeptide repeat protein [Helicobacter sp.]